VNKLYYGDNLDILREHIPDESVDLIYLDPPFNSNRSYNVLFREANGTSADAQITAFDDSWSWGPTAQATLHEIELTAAPHIVKMIQAIVDFVGRNDMSAYLVMMTVRLIELHRVLKLTGSIYLHCDPTASHYLKVVMDAVFGKENFVNEVVWKRTYAHGDAGGQKAKHLGRVHDVILFYSRENGRNHYNPVYQPYDPEYVERVFRHKDPDGRRWQSLPIDGPGGAAKGNPQYEVMGITRYWRYSQERMQGLIDQGLVYQSRPGAVPRRKGYLDESHGILAQDIWTDIQKISSRANERLGYPTQKPLALLERIIQVSSNESGVVLDPFCGCGTTIAAAQKLNRQWIGIDITHLAVSLMESRLREMFGDDVPYEVIGVPQDVHSARALAEHDRFQFEWWALSLIKARPYQGKTKGADRGTDGVLFFVDEAKSKAKQVVVQVKSGHVQSSYIRDLCAVVEREKAVMGFFITLEPPTKPMITEALAAGYYHSPGWNRDYQKIQILTIEQLLDGQTFDMPPTNITLARAERAKKEGSQGELF